MTAREVVLEGGPPWGFRMHGGADVKQPLRISRVNPGSKAAHRGIREGDLISNINGQGTKDLTNSEAHSLLKNAGDTLKLGLNEEPVGSPKRRQYRTIHQETLQETIKRSSVTSYSIKKTVETVETPRRASEKSNENTLAKTNEKSNINGTSKNIPPSNIVVSQRSTLSSNSSNSSTPSGFVKEGDFKATSPDNAEASPRSSYTNCTLTPTNTSTFSEDGNCSCTASQLNDRRNNENTRNTPDKMSDNINTSRSKKRRLRRKNRKQNENQYDDIEDISNSCDNNDNLVVETKNVEELRIEYRVDSPVDEAKNKRKKIKKPIKSKSLDDDETMKIQELSETSDIEDKENQAIVSEASESEVEWEETMDLATPPPLHGTLSTMTLPLSGYSTEQVTLMSPEEEKTLRDFLEGLNLVNGPDEAAQHVYDKSDMENIKQRKAKKRAALEQYFFPISQNPRYLDVICEEASDKDSDKEQSSVMHHLKQGTPELEILDKPPAVPPRLSRDKRRALQKKYAAPVEQPQAVLVGTKILDNFRVSEGFCSTSKAAEATSSVEIVYLNDSSESNSPGDFDSTSNDSYVLESESEKNSSSETIDKQLDKADCADTKTAKFITPNTQKTTNSTKSDIEIDSDTINEEAKKTTNVNFKDNSQNISNPTNEMHTHKHDSLAQTCNTYEELCGKNETFTTSKSTKFSFVIKTNEKIQTDNEISKTVIENGLTSQLTPPPTPENMSPKNEGNNVQCFEQASNTCLKSEEVVTKQNNYVKFSEKTESKETSASNSNQNSSQPVVTKINITKSEISDTKELGYKKYAEKENKICNEETEDAAIYTNVVSPPPPSLSTSSSASSSRESSQCTAKYNPLNSSIADVTSITKDEELLKEIKLLQPLTLREMCLKFLMTLPFGADILQELADVSKSIESYTSALPSTLLPKIVPNLAPLVNTSKNDPNNLSCNLSVKNSPNDIPAMTKWVGIPTERDPKLLVYLSPKQREELEKTKKVSDEAGKLIELHEKFLNRSNRQEEVKKENEEKVTVTNLSNGTVNVTSPTSNRLLAIIKEEPPTSYDDNNYLFFEEKEPREIKTSATLPRNSSNDSARLQAKDLSEWLHLARNKSMSESNLNTAPDIPENNLRKDFNMQPAPRRRTSLPYNLYERQMYYIQEKEREIQRQLEQLEEEKRKLTAEISPSRQFHAEDYYFSRRGDFAETKQTTSRPTSMPAMPTEFFRKQMYEEYMDKFAAREDRKHNKVIKVTSSKDINQPNEKGVGKEIIHPILIEDEFMDIVKQKQQQGKLATRTENGVEEESSFDKEKDEDPPVLVMDGDKLKGTKQLPKHLQEFVDITKQVAVDQAGIWSPGQRQDNEHKEVQSNNTEKPKTPQDESIPPTWAPTSANSSPTVERKEFRPVSFQSPVLSRKTRTKSENLGSESPSSAPPWKIPDYSSDTGIASSTLEKRLPTSFSSPASGFGDFSTSPRLPKAQNPTITLLQKAREGQLPRGAAYIEQEPKHFRPKNDRPPIAGPADVLYQIKNEYTSESDSERPRKMADLGPRKFEGIGPVTKDGMPLILRSEIKDQNQSKWYKRMYDTIHKQKPHSDEYVTVRYKQRRAQYPYTSGYLSEPEPGAYDSDFTDYKYQTLDRRRPYVQEKHSDYYTTSSTMPRNLSARSSSSNVLRNTHEYYRNQPGRIENYTPGHSSISEKEAKEWWDEVMDIFDGHLEQQKRVPPQPRSFINQALKESGYESDSTLVFRRREEAAQQLSPKEQKQAYKVIQKGGDVPLHGLRKPAPERPKDPEPPVPPPKGQHARNHEPESPRKYVENEVTIHYKTPVRQEIKEYLSEDELAYRQAEAMKKIYQEERRKKYLQELQDMNSRRHTDNFIPSQKSPISLNRYDDFDDLALTVKSRPRSPEPRLVARALYNFVGQTARELTFRKGDLIYVRRQVDKNWYEGELNAMVGLFPTNYVEIVPYDGIKTTPRKSYEGQARAKYNFVAQTHLELSLAKGELVVITRRVDNNWFEGKIGGRKGIFPASYVEVLIDPQDPPPPNTKPVATPAAHSLLLNGSAGGKESMGTHCYTPNLSNTQLTSSYHAKPIQVSTSGSYGSLDRPMKNSVNQALHIETQSEPVPYRALYKYNPQNDDELELLEGDTVYVLEKCDDGWYVGSSNRTGAFGTFPGNYVEKI